MRDIDDFNRLEERAWQLTGQLEEGTYKSQKPKDGIDEKSEQTAAQQATNQPLKKKPMPMRCRLCLSGVLKVNCLVCDIMEYEQ